MRVRDIISTLEKQVVDLNGILDATKHGEVVCLAGSPLVDVTPERIRQIENQILNARATIESWRALDA